MAAAAGTPNLRRHIPLITVSVLLAFFVLVAACSSSEKRTVEQRGNALDRQLICPICPGETIDQAQVQIARDMRKIVREKLADGESESEIKDFFVARYGISVLASPPASGFNLLVWVVPPVGLAGALAALYFTMREMSRRRTVAVTPDGYAVGDAADESLAPYLDAVDQEMRQNQSASEASPVIDSPRENDTSSSRHQPDNEGGGGIEI